MAILDRDSDIHFPHFSVLKASAGSGKTYTLTERYVQFLLSDKIPGNNLRNILAITFSNNAAKEMKERVLLWLKSVYLNDAGKVAELSNIVSLDKEEMSKKAGLLIDEILDSYSDFQVKTIDSFMTTVFKSSALDFGYNPDFDILMNGDQVMRYSFDLFLRNVKEGTEEAGLFDEIVSVILEQKKKGASYPWDPSTTLLDEIKNIYRKLASSGKPPVIEDLSKEAAALKAGISKTLEDIECTIDRLCLERNCRSAYKSILPLTREGRFADLIGKGTKMPPINKIKKCDATARQSYDRVLDMWEDLSCMIRRFTSIYVRSYYMPYLRVYDEFRDTIERVKKHQGKVFIEDINRDLAGYLNKMMVPDVYFRIGETIFHFLVDEFQDTSPVQWRNLLPLIENSLAQNGSAFIVGDTKQAIYGFRNADYTIMKDFETNNPFPSAEHIVRELETNFRSLETILDFNEKVFKEVVAGHAEYRAAGEMSGLIDYVQRVKSGWGYKGEVEVVILDRDDEDPPERQKIQEMTAELLSRGYNYGDIAILTQRNEDAVRATIWLNEKGVPFISYSSLDIRRRKITGEVVAFLNFLDSPTDDLSFATVILGDIFSRTLAQDFPDINASRLREFLFVHRGDSPLYKAFQSKFSLLWERYFEGMFKSAGYFPLYDLVSELFSMFRVFEIMAEEEATFVKVLDVVKDFEGEGYNSIRDFLTFADDSDAGEAGWNMDVPKGLNAVKVMTIHKAKGLGFPVAIVLLYEEQNRGFDYIVRENEDKVRLLRLSQSTMESDPEFETLYNEEALREKVNRLNRLYVGFTRPQEELYVIGVKGRCGRYPIDLLPASDFPPHPKPHRESKGGIDHGRVFDISHHHRRIEFRISPEEMISLDERRRGEFIHMVLAAVEYAGAGFDEELVNIIRRLQEEKGTEYPEDEIKEKVLGLVTHKDVAGYFEQLPGRQVRTEQEFSDSEGNLFRMDRLVIDQDRVTVIDYKTGLDRQAEEKHISQLRNYMKILSNVWPQKTINGAIAYIDLRQVRRLD